MEAGHCSIPVGVTLEGVVAKVVKRGPGVKWEEVDLRFLPIPCPIDDTQEVIPLLVAIHGPKKNSNDDMLARDVIMTAFAQTAGSHSASPGVAPRPAPPATLGTNNVFALSDSGQRLAILADASVRIYRIGQAP